ncbi:hypothetical protein COU80_05205 [Candidatus Peregrinibacteria bacterium CG10_big_fil_rev_8_21_14_0_10_55_24]|nr:MAG: hypothetical protein COU80_05205 [Candidatus Peregrinibacteria bacterium CG10_big_fil_rev_8_21_14_0_10_55_24]
MTYSALQFPASPRLSAVFQRVALPFLLFSAVLLSLLGLSAALLLPQLTQVTILGEERSALELRASLKNLQANVVAMEQQRAALVTPLHDGMYARAKARKFARPTFLALRTLVLDAANGTVPDQPDAIRLTRVSYTADDGRMILDGTVEGVGARSMTVLAQFVDTLKRSPHVSELSMPRFTRESTGNGETVSPFHFDFLAQ